MSFKSINVDDKVGESNVFVTSEVDVDTFSIDYEIKKFPDLDENIFSPVFVGGPQSQHEWKLKVEPKSKKDGEDTEYVGVYLYLVKKSEGPKRTGLQPSSDNEPCGVRARFQMCLINSGRKVLYTQSSSVFSNFNPGKTSWGRPHFILKSDILNPKKGYLADGHILKIHCEISINLGPGSSKIVNNNLKINSHSDPQPTFELFSKTMSSFLDAGKFADFIIQTNTSSFPVCKVLLAARSDVFNSMFNSGMRETTENSIKIEDHSDEAVKGMLVFIYTGKLDLAETNVKDLLSISDKYQVLDMKQKCEKFLLENLKIENAADTLIMAHFHSPALKPQVMSYINRYKQQVQLTDGFSRMENTHPSIVFDLYKSNN